MFPEDTLIWFTDGSRANSGTGSGIFGIRPNRSFSFPLGKFATVFQTEIHAILQCACENIRRAYKHKRILIFSNSQAALKVLSSPKVTSGLVAECMDALSAPPLGIPRCSAREAIKNWTKHQHYSAWKDLPGQKHGKLFIGRPRKKRANDLLKLSRHQLQIVVAILMGHASVRNLYIMGLFGDPTCRFCRMETESAAYYLLLQGVGSSAL